MNRKIVLAKINGFRISRLKSYGHYQYHTDVVKLIVEANPGRLGIAVLFDVYKLALAREDDALKRIVKSEYTEQIKDADKKRDTIYISIKKIVKTALKHYNKDVVAAAKRLMILIETYEKVTSIAYREQTSAIYNILQEFNGKYADDIALLRIPEMVAELEVANKSVEELMDIRSHENAQKNTDTMKEVRAETDAAYDSIVERINALVVVEGEENYLEFITNMNELIDQYKIMIARQHPKKKDVGDDENGKIDDGDEIEYDDEDEIL